MSRMEQGITIIIPTYNGGDTFSECMEKVREQDYSGEVQLIVIDSGSTDGTPELAREAGALVKSIDKREFHHARTRNEALSLARFEKVVHMVQDAVPLSSQWLSGLERSLYNEEDVAAAYTDQVPHEDADLYARFEIESISRLRGQKPIVQYLDSLEAFNGMDYDKAYRRIGLDNVCAIYRKKLLMDIPFPEVDFAEDLAWAFKNMLMGHKIRYQPEIKVKHSHNRSPEYRFNREVVNSKFVARIMNRVKEDLSFLTVRDLMILTREIEPFVSKLKLEVLGRDELPGGKGEDSVGVIGQILNKYSIRNKVMMFFLDNFSKNPGPHTDASIRIEQQVKEGIRHIFSLIKENYWANSRAELLEALEEVTASVLGKLYGEVYASHMLKNKVSPGLEGLMKPYLSGI